MSKLIYNLENQVRLSTSPEHKNLYTWSIQERDPATKEVRIDQIPWVWSKHFNSLKMHLLINVQSDNEKNGITEFILAKLHPEQRHPDSIFKNTYSFFGTDRVVQHFDIRIVASHDGIERCTVWGAPEQEVEIDFRNELMPDQVQFNIELLPENFRKLADQIASGEEFRCDFAFSFVRGFYSGWSPGISTNSIKILASVQDQQVKIPEGCPIDPPVLGQVGEFHIYFRKGPGMRGFEYDAWHRKKTKKLDLEEEETQPQTIVEKARETTHADRSELSKLIRAPDTRIMKLTVPLWIAVACLIYLALRS